MEVLPANIVLTKTAQPYQNGYKEERRSSPANEAVIRPNIKIINSFLAR